MFQWKTCIKRKTLAPVFNESFSYEVTEEMRMGVDMQNITITFDVIDHSRLMLNDKMGCVCIGKDVSNKLGRQHWDEVLKSPTERISFWHPIQLPPGASQKRHKTSKSGLSPVPPEMY